MFRWLQHIGSAKPRDLGRKGEAVAARFLRRAGYKIVARQRRTRPGELDLVAVDGRTIVFVEVKTRRSHGAGHPAEAVDRRKQQRIASAAIAFLKGHGLLDYPARFDIVAVTWQPQRRRPVIEHYPAAFEAPLRGDLYS